MTEWCETYRGVVNAWECDVVQHFTIAYYFERFADARRNLFDLMGMGDTVGTAVRYATSRSHATFRHELRAGAGFHILSAVAGVAERVLQLGHQVVDSTGGNTVCWLLETLAFPDPLSTTAIEQLGAATVAWPGPKLPDARPRSKADGALTARDRVKPRDIGEDGAMSLAAHVHRFSAANMQALAATGMTAGYMHQQRRGFSTFELDLTRFGSAHLGEMLDVRTYLSHIGKSSLRFVHRMAGPRGREVAQLVQSGVHLDMDARRSTAIPDEVRESMGKWLVQDE